MTLRDSVRPKMPDKSKKVWVDFPCSKTYLKVRCILVQRQHIMITKRRSGIPIIWVRRSNPLWRGRQKGHKNACQYNHERQIESQQKNIQTDNRMKGHIQRWKCSFLHPLIVKVDSARSVPQVTMLLLFILSDLLVFYPRWELQHTSFQIQAQRVSRNINFKELW